MISGIYRTGIVLLNIAVIILIVINNIKFFFPLHVISSLNHVNFCIKAGKKYDRYGRCVPEKFLQKAEYIIGIQTLNAWFLKGRHYVFSMHMVPFYDTIK